MTQNDSKATAEPNRMVELVRDYVRKRIRKDELSASKSEAELELTSAKKTLSDYMLDIGVKSVKFDDLGHIMLKAPTPRPNYKKEDEAAVFDFVATNNGSAIIKTSIHPSSFSSFIKEKIEEGIDIPEIIDVYMDPNISWTPAPEGKEVEG